MRMMMRAQQTLKTDRGKDVLWMGTLLAVMLALFACGDLNAGHTARVRSVPVVTHFLPQDAPSALART